MPVTQKTKDHKEFSNCYYDLESLNLANTEEVGLGIVQGRRSFAQNLGQMLGGNFSLNVLIWFFSFQYWGLNLGP
jgi:hypothetical protein